MDACWLSEDTYKLSLAFAQVMPGPLAAQTAIAIGYFEAGVLGATLVGLAFVLPSFLMVVAISLAYVAYGGLWWMQALFYAIGATVIAIIAIAGLAGAIMASIGIFLPVYLFTIFPAPWFKRHRDNAQLKAFVDGATAPATGAITGAVLVLGARAIVDVPTAVIALASLAALWRFRLSEPVLVTISGVVGLILWPLLRSV